MENPPEIDWTLPDGAQTLYWDHVHFPRPLAPLGFDFIARWMMGGAQGRRIVNGYVFRPFPSWGGFQLDDYGITADHELPDPVRIWEDQTLPVIEDICDRVRNYDYDSLNLERFVSAMPSIFSACGDAMRLTMNPYSAFNARTSRLLTFVQDELGEGAALQVVTMLQGLSNPSADSGSGLGKLAELAEATPEVAAALTEERYGDLETLPGAAPFMVALKSYLHEFGWRSPTWGEVHVKTWAEDPTPALGLVRRFVLEPERRPAAAIARARAQREAAVGDTESRLPQEKLPAFRRLLAEAEAHVPICESRAMWQLISCGVARIPILAFGRRLVERGSLSAADDVFFLRLAELQRVAGGEQEGVADMVRQRRAELEAASKTVPPFMIGRASPFRQREWFEEPGADTRVVRGVAASRGTVTARARIVMSLDDSDRLKAGDILVCPSTAPPWTPMFAFASAVITDSGGILSHSAIAAREYGIPAVVGCNVATQRIPDGAMVTVDGAQGIIRIE